VARDAANHSSIATTSIYDHVTAEGHGEIANIFAVADPPANCQPEAQRMG
jgi:hypothetical protein